VSKSLRLSEKWFRRGLWLVSFIFATFLIGLGGNLVSDLPRVEERIQLEDFIDTAKMAPLREALSANEVDEQTALETLNTLSRQLKSAREDTTNARETFDNWVSTRQVTQRPDQDAELIRRTQHLETLQEIYAQIQKRFSTQNNLVEDIRQQQSTIRQQMSELEHQAYELQAAEYRKVELRVFLYRLALTLPLLAIAGFLFVKKRHGKYWPFTWGFIFFALFAFFVELVPYLPSYGGYVRYAVGILLTLVIGYYGINALNSYLARQKLAEEQPETVRRQELSYDLALARLGKGICPGCERGVDLKNQEIDFCPHCGISLFDHCTSCQSRKSAFSQFCHRCGVHAKTPEKPAAVVS
jgi:predicted RNA-binding Zn-ribbon protein involved in translation (DUF1610 family)